MEPEADLDVASVDEEDAQTEVPTAVEAGEEPSSNEETSAGTVRTLPTFHSASLRATAELGSTGIPGPIVVETATRLT